jgi:hypothetical protein
VQILQINNESLAGYSESKVHSIIQKCGVNNIVMAVRDRLEKNKSQIPECGYTSSIYFFF